MEKLILTIILIIIVVVGIVSFLWWLLGRDSDWNIFGIDDSLPFKKIHHYRTKKKNK